MPFTPTLRQQLLARSRRQCCVCHAPASRDVEVHHIVPQADGGTDDVDNAIVLCLRCHAEAGHYNPKHSRGTKYSPAELKSHRDQWFAYCDSGFQRDLKPAGYKEHAARDPKAQRKPVGVLWSQRADIDKRVEYIEFDGDLIASMERTDGRVVSSLELFRLKSDCFLIYVQSNHHGDWTEAVLHGAQLFEEPDKPLTLARLQKEFPDLATVAGLSPTRRVEE